ncbi:MAG: hypothetical protein PVF51_10965 [Nitrospirota bacterium]|jgi:hypothetical protein
MTPVTIVGMAAGSILILAVVAISWSNKAFPAGGIAVSLIGVVLIGMSQSSIVKSDRGGASIELVREQISQTAAAVEAVAAQAEQTAAAVEETKA